MREATKEERESVNNYIKSISQKAVIIKDRDYIIKTCKEFKDNLENFQKINILGTEYCLKQYSRDVESHDTALGLCDFWNKIIYIDFEWYIKAEENGFGCINRMYKTIRHELIHAFLYEIGNVDDSLNEGLADALSIKATQFVQMLHPFMDENQTNISTIIPDSDL